MVESIASLLAVGQTEGIFEVPDVMERDVGLNRWLK